jgi:hypothetical protein
MYKFISHLTENTVRYKDLCINAVAACYEYRSKPLRTLLEKMYSFLC